MKQTKLYIFTTSPISDPYINVIAHCVANYKNFNQQVILIGIIGDRGRLGSKKDELDKLKLNINTQLTQLSKGNYSKRKGDNWDTLAIQIEPADRQRYSDLRSISLDVRVWIYEELEKEISTLLDSSDSYVHIFDVTAVLKAYLVDIYTILRFKGVSGIYSFELFNKPSYNQKDLIHSLTYRKTYDYTCLTESSYTKNKIVISKALIVSKNDFNQLQSDFERLEKNRNDLEDVVATDFAKFWSLVYFLTWLPVFVWLCWSIAQPEGWNRVEPITFIVPFGWFLLNYLLQILFTGRFPSLNPKELFHVLKNRKKRNLERYRSSSSKI